MFRILANGGLWILTIGCALAAPVCLIVAALASSSVKTRISLGESLYPELRFIVALIFIPAALGFGSFFGRRWLTRHPRLYPAAAVVVAAVLCVIGRALFDLFDYPTNKH